MCVSALILSKGITFSYVGPAGVVMQGRYAGLTLPNQKNLKLMNIQRYNKNLLTATEGLL